MLKNIKMWESLQPPTPLPEIASEREESFSCTHQHPSLSDQVWLVKIVKIFPWCYSKQLTYLKLLFAELLNVNCVSKKSSKLLLTIPGVSVAAEVDKMISSA